MKRFSWEVRPVALPENCVIAGNCRVTVLTPNLLRLEYAPDGCFEDRASQMAFYRDFPSCAFTQETRDGILTVQTEALRLRYRLGETFAEDTLSVKLLTEPASSWHFGEDFEDLGGTAKTLDNVDGRFPVGRGVCARNGFSVLDDSGSLLLEADGEIGIRTPGSIDCYFFGYGFDYVGAVQALYRLTGVPPLLPAYALGNWWSRYHAYTQQEYLELMDQFRQENIPFSVGVVDMDWHITKIPEEYKIDRPRMRNGWTGYTWNTELFPDYKQFLQELHKRNLKTALNLHPAQGVRPHEAVYPQMARACGIDPASKQHIPLNVLSQEFMAKYFDILHHPYEEDGVDFWWMDWQQGRRYWWIHEPNEPGQYRDERERMDPLWILNHLHIMDISRNGKRPMFFSRYSGPGSHRYPVGFSGDTYTTWRSLDFQPEFTATASNVGYSWWSHDIGGHQNGQRDDQLYLRWLQLGVFSPINRLHSTRSQHLRKEPFMYAPETGRQARRWLRLRHSLFPYLYTMNYRNHRELLPLVQPMYYSHPKCSGAYEVPNQFWFGSQLIAVPITQKSDPKTDMGAADAWLPKGYWFDLFNGLCYASRRGRKLRVNRATSEMPVFAKSGAIVPMANYADHENVLSNCPDMTVLVFPGSSNRFCLYEDAGEGNAYAEGAFAETEMQLQWSDAPVFTIRAAQGDTSLIPAERVWRVGLRGFHSGVAADVRVNGSAVQAQRQWEQDTNTLWITVKASTAAEVTVSVSGETLITDNSCVRQKIDTLVQLAQCTTFEKQEILKCVDDPDSKLWGKYAKLVGTLMMGSLGDTIFELLSLTEDPYTGSEIPK